MANLGLNRQQLAQFLPNHEAIKAFEALFSNVQETIPTALDDVQATADNATLQAAEALAGLAQVANALSLALYGSYNEVVSQDNFVAISEQAQQDFYIPPYALGSMAEQNADKVNISGGTISGVSFSGTNIVAPETHAAASKATPVDADELPLADSAASFGLAKLTWANLKATLLTWLNGVLAAPPAIGGTTPGNATFAQLTAKSTVTIGAITAGTSLNFLSAGATLSITPNNASGVNGVDYSTSFVAGGAGPHNFNIGGTKYAAVTTSGLATIGGAVFHTTTSALTNGAAAAAGTLLNAPVAGNPTKWIGINDNGTTRYIPAW